MLCKHEVVGSNPSTSTKFMLTPAEQRLVREHHQLAMEYSAAIQLNDLDTARTKYRELCKIWAKLSA